MHEMTVKTKHQRMHVLDYSIVIGTLPYDSLLDAPKGLFICSYAFIYR